MVSKFSLGTSVWFRRLAVLAVRPFMANVDTAAIGSEEAQKPIVYPRALFLYPQLSVGLVPYCVQSGENAVGSLLVWSP